MFSMPTLLWRYPKCEQLTVRAIMMEVGERAG